MPQGLVDQACACQTLILSAILCSPGPCADLLSSLSAPGGGSGVSAFRQLSHSFIVVAAPPGAGPAGLAVPGEVVVDPCFREQFDIPQVRPPTRMSYEPSRSIPLTPVWELPAEVSAQGCCIS